MRTQHPRLKNHFDRYRCPDTSILDSRTQIGNNKSKGAEAAVKTSKNLIKKRQERKEAPYIGVLNQQNTPIEDVRTSPALKLFNRQTKTMLPTAKERLSIFNSQNCVLDSRKAVMASLRKDPGRQLKPLTIGEQVRMQPVNTGNKEWKPAVVTKQIGNRTFMITEEAGTKYQEK